MQFANELGKMVVKHKALVRDFKGGSKSKAIKKMKGTVGRDKDHGPYIDYSGMESKKHPKIGVAK